MAPRPLQGFSQGCLPLVGKTASWHWLSALVCRWTLSRRSRGPIEGAALGYLEGWRPWADEARTSGTGEEDPRFPSLIDLFVHHGRSIEIVEGFLPGIKERTKEELQYWAPGGSAFKTL
jgi:hypothetical protein